MQTLNPFNNSTFDFKLEGDVFRRETSLNLVYKVADSKNLLNLPAGFTSDENSMPRKDGLWNGTCFQMFLRLEGKPSYYEFNFSLDKAWNQYFFDSYRTPQPPRPSADFSLKQIQWDGQILKVELTGLAPQAPYQISLTAVLKERNGAIHYMAVKHAGSEADFHHQDSLILRV